MLMYDMSRSFLPAPASLTQQSVNQGWAMGTAESVAECTACAGYGINSLDVSLLGVAAIPGAVVCGCVGS